MSTPKMEDCDFNRALAKLSREAQSKILETAASQHADIKQAAIDASHAEEEEESLTVRTFSHCVRDVKRKIDERYGGGRESLREEDYAMALDVSFSIAETLKSISQSVTPHSSYGTDVNAVHAFFEIYDLVLAVGRRYGDDIGTELRQQVDRSWGSLFAEFLDEYFDTTKISRMVGQMRENGEGLFVEWLGYFGKVIEKEDEVEFYTLENLLNCMAEGSPLD